MYEIASLYLASVAAKAGLNLTWSQNAKTRFVMTGLNFFTQPALADSVNGSIVC